MITVHEDKGTRLDRKSWDSKHWHRRQSKWKKTIKEMRDKKATEDGVPGSVLRLLG
jgi:hypothetical protein